MVYLTTPAHANDKSKAPPVCISLLSLYFYKKYNGKCNLVSSLKIFDLVNNIERTTSPGEREKFNVCIRDLRCKNILISKRFNNELSLSLSFSLHVILWANWVTMPKRKRIAVRRQTLHRKWSAVNHTNRPHLLFYCLSCR